ncbi:hypothetical protein FNV43_RR22645 [Rhamnella rubrinervis]|uniref:Uncharacterized protein n=1 Tax=Rhamnella rubrinervis TaxID=2594499 RepID=A0A8K0DVM5_9ROSA|nr:hypothetical protein FNV43_RR22645 [Rhamnella rubrinervis]
MHSGDKASGISHETVFSLFWIVQLTLTLTVWRHGRKPNASVSALNHKDASIVVEVDTKSKISANLILTKKLLPSIKTTASFNLLDDSSSKFRFQFLHEDAALAMCITLNQPPAISLSASIDTSSIALGTEGKTKMGELLKASYVHFLDQEMKISAAVEIIQNLSTHISTFRLGGSFAVDRMTDLKAKPENYRKLQILTPRASTRYLELGWPLLLCFEMSRYLFDRNLQWLSQDSYDPVQAASSLLCANQAAKV